ncbi:bifunctional protein-serine/threonine kinase/phosphatase [Ramlibacter alkalitolerans]|uniref:bifunctional protein-serine/threonine kinase/phosphatase n=1 Tax=Ramlibacter alkalitolerans TaxID=2039631 RepID=UPI002ED2955E
MSAEGRTPALARSTGVPALARVTASLRVAVGAYSDQGPKPSNQDAHGLHIPREPQRASKGVALAIADGISSSDCAAQASQAAIRGFLGDYYCTSEAWSVKKSVERVLAATNAWLFAHTQAGQGRYDRDRGWVCTFSALVIKSRTAHLFHVGDARIWQVQGRALEQLTTDHRIAAGGGRSYLGRALGIAPHLEIDYRSLPLQEGDTFLLTTDGVHEALAPQAMLAALDRHGADLDAAARDIAQEALRQGSRDNVTVQILRVQQLPAPQVSELQRLAGELPLPPLPEPRGVFDGWRMLRELHASSRSHLWLAQDLGTGARAVLKLPSLDLRGDPATIERLLLEEWVARRVASAHVLQAADVPRPRGFAYVAMEYVQGATLRQWMLDHPRPALETVRDIVDQLARGLRALHRMEMVHQDLRPENIMIDAAGTVRIIDFGAVQVAGLAETAEAPAHRLGTPQYTAPEALLGAPGSPRSDLFALAVIAYELLSGRLPYGAQLAQCRTLPQQKRLRLPSLRASRPELAHWVDDAIARALQLEPQRRHEDVAEFAYALRRPDPGLRPRRARPLIERDPVVFWKGLALLLALACVALLAVRASGS